MVVLISSVIEVSEELEHELAMPVPLDHRSKYHTRTVLYELGTAQWACCLLAIILENYDNLLQQISVHSI